VQRGWSLFFGAVLLAELGLYLTARFFIPGWGLPPLANAESFGKDVDRLYYVIEGPVGFFFILTEAVLVYSLWRFAGKPNARSVYIHGDHRLEMAWTAIPALILLFIAFAQIHVWADIKYPQQLPPQQVFEVSARQFGWAFRYPDVATRESITVEREGEPFGDRKKKADDWGRNPLADKDDLHVVNEVHTWQGANTRVYLKTRDVLHSFFLPSMRLKQDAVPGKDFIPVWFKPTDYNGEYRDGGWVYAKDKEGRNKVWEMTCAELCGWGHYKMNGYLYVHRDKGSYDRWLADALKKQRTTTREKEPEQK
jgi:cytochrome c oxidase subunit 2